MTFHQLYGDQVSEPLDLYLKDCMEDLSDIHIDKELARKKLSALNEFKAQGPVNIHPKVLKELADELSEPLAVLYEQSVQTATVPQR